MEKPEKQEPIVAELVSMGHALMRAENETLQSIAFQRPRDESKVLAGALRELEMVPEYADEAFYSIPYKDRKTGKDVYVEGLSIGAAMSLLRRFGNAASGARPLGSDPEGFDLEGVCIDYETNVRVTRPYRVSRFLKLRDGSTVRLDDKRQLMAFQAGVSKAIRNATLALLPEYLKRAFFNRAKIIAAGEAVKPADQKRVAATIYAFSRLGIGEQRLVERIGKPKDQWVGGDLATLIGLGQAIRDGELSAAEAFEQEAPTVSTPSGLTPEALKTAAVASKDDARHDEPVAPPAEAKPKPEPKAAKPAKPEQTAIPAASGPAPCNHAGALGFSQRHPGKVYVCACGAEIRDGAVLAGEPAAVVSEAEVDEAARAFE